MTASTTDFGTGVQAFLERSGRVCGVRLETSEIVPADVVVTVGAIPATGRLKGSGLELDGVLSAVLGRSMPRQARKHNQQARPRTERTESGHREGCR